MYNNFLPQNYAPQMDALARMQGWGQTPIPQVTDLGSTIDSAGLAGMAPSAGQSTFMAGMLGDPRKGTNGWGGLALGAAQGAIGGFLGLKQLKTAKESLGEARRQFDLNFDAQRKTLNTQMEDRQRARVASNPGAYQSVGDYMNKNRV